MDGRRTEAEADAALEAAKAFQCRSAPQRAEGGSQLQRRAWSGLAREKKWRVASAGLFSAVKGGHGSSSFHIPWPVCCRESFI